jgi:hypothetical protein
MQLRISSFLPDFSCGGTAFRSASLHFPLLAGVLAGTPRSGARMQLRISSGSDLLDFQIRFFAPDSFHGLLRIPGLSEIVPLDVVASQREQRLELFFGFHAFGNHLHFEAVRQRNNARNQERVIYAVAQVGNERLVDLEEVHMESPEVAQARIPGTEIVEGDFETHLRKFPQGHDGHFHVFHQHALGDFYADFFWGNSRFQEDFRDITIQMPRTELLGGKVNGDFWDMQSLTFPFDDFFADIADRPIADLHDLPGVFRDRNEF